MAAVLPHAGVNQSAPNLAKGPVTGLKVPSASSPVKPGETSLLGKFQALLDHAKKVPAADKGAHAAEKPVHAPEAAEKLADKAVLAKAKAKTPEAAEKPKEAKKTEAKDQKSDAAEALAASLAAGQAVQPVVPKVEAKAKAPDADALAADKPKAKVDKKAGDVAPVTAASVEIAQAQAKTSSPRADRTEDKQKVFVVDRRSDKEKEKLKSSAEAVQPVNASVEVQTQAKPVDQKTNTDVQVNFQTVAGKASDTFDLKGQAAPPSPRDAISFQQYLVDKGYGQLVDQARIVLKDNNAGEIRMTLYPESLGKVKVSLNLDDNSLAGQIFVENQTVKDVFQSNMDGLMQAFQDGGWNDVSVQVQVGGDGGTGTQNPSSRQGTPARTYGNQVTQTVVGDRSNRIGSWNDGQINLTA
jgi:flagellar protein FlbC